MSKDRKLYDFSAFGKAVKEARTSSDITREQLAEKLGITARHLAQIENKGQHPSFQVFYELATMFNISVDQFFFPGRSGGYTTKQRQVIALIEKLGEADLVVVEATAAELAKRQ